MSDVLFLCPQCNRGRPLAAYEVESRVQCLNCEVSFRTVGYLFDRVGWLEIGDPWTSAAVAVGMGHKLSARKWRLLACAIGRVAFDWCRNPWFRDALQLAERWADEGTPPRGVEMCRRQLDRVPVPAFLEFLEEFEDLGYPGGGASLQFQRQQERDQFSWVQLARRCVGDDPRLQFDDITEVNRSLTAKLLRDLVPNPFLSLRWNPDWFTSTVRDIGAHVYTARESGAMPILADAIQDAGCDDEQILTHCRDAKQLHVRGCWVLDAILGKS
jgi:hypothetical protein